MRQKIRKLVRWVYDRTVRTVIPTKISIISGIPVRGEIRLFDQKDTFTGYKTSNIAALRRNVCPSDTVVVIGGGMGVTTVVAAKTAIDGNVIVYEASKQEIEKIQSNIELNAVSDSVSVVHGIVGELKESFGELDGAKQIDPSDIPTVDVLEMDCEGSELSILELLEQKPRIIIVETHPNNGSNTNAVVDRLESMGYQLIDSKPDPVDGDVLTAKRKP